MSLDAEAGTKKACGRERTYVRDRYRLFAVTNLCAKIIRQTDGSIDKAMAISRSSYS